MSTERTERGVDGVRAGGAGAALCGRAACVARAWCAAVCVVAGVLSVCGREAAGQGQPVWATLTAAQPVAASGHAMAYDARRAVAVCFGGGYRASLYYDDRDTWEWNGVVWVRRSMVGPQGRSWHRMVYDSDRGVVVMFGGGASDNFGVPLPHLGDTWEWGGSAWTQRATTGPAARVSHSMAYDPARRVVVLFGGRTMTGTVGDTWEWNGQQWTNRAVSGPGARAGAGMVYDAARGTMVMQGGHNIANQPVSDTWEWNGAVWVMRSSGAAFNGSGSLVYDPVRGRVVSPAAANLWEWDGSTWVSRASVTVAALGSGYSAVFDEARGGVFVRAGGSAVNGTLDPPNALWQWVPGGWSRRQPSNLPARSGTAAVHDSTRGMEVLFGGAVGTAALAETWERTTAGWHTLPVPGPTARHKHAMAYDTLRQETVLFGGTNNTAPNAETWTWNGSVWTQRVASGPTARSGHAMAFDRARGAAVLFGGTLSDGTLSGQTWTWFGGAWTQRNAGPSARTGHAMAYDEVRRVVVLFGGVLASGGRSREIWEWDSVRWSLRNPSGVLPGFTSDHAMAYHATRGTVVVSGGMRATTATGTASVTPGVWEWNGSVVNPLPSMPGARAQHAMVYDETDDTLVVASGTDGTTNPQPDTVLLMGTPPTQTVSPAAGVLCPGGDQAFTSAATGSGLLNYQWYRFGAALSGATAATHTVAWRSLPGTYSCRVSSPFGSADAFFIVSVNVLDYSCDAVVNADDLGDFITDYYLEAAVAGPGGYAGACPGNEAPYDAGYAAAFTRDLSVQCTPPFADNLGDFITAYFGG